MRLDRFSMRLAGTAALLCASAWAQTTTRVSVRSNGLQSDGVSSSASISSDGRYVAFASDAKNLVLGDSNGFTDVFVHDRQTGTTTRVSVSSGGAQADGDSGSPRISPDGRFIAFVSVAGNLVSGDTNGSADIFVRDLQDGTTTRASVDSTGAEGNGPSFAPSISSDGRAVAFHSYATNLVTGDTNDSADVFVRDLKSATTTRVSVDSRGVQGDSNSLNPSISSDGRFVAFESVATNLVPDDTNGAADVFVHDLQREVTTRVSVDSRGAQADGDSVAASISSDGRHVAFESLAANLVLGDDDDAEDVFAHDLSTGATSRVSVDSSGAEGDAGSSVPAISSDGRFVAFESFATNLVPGDTNGWKDVFVHDLQTGATALVSVNTTGLQGDGGSYRPSLSSDGREVAFESAATNLVSGDTNAAQDVFVRDGGAASAFTSFCFGDGTGAACPCFNSGAAGHGCQNSATTGGAVLAASGEADLSADTVQLTSSGELPNALSIVLQGSSAIAAAHFGDGLRCAGGSLKRLYVRGASGGVVTAPQAGDASISARSAALGDPIPEGATRNYQVYYRDPSASFCPPQRGGTFNVSNAIAIAWGS
jgi:Tol biopolymer transport system component